MGFGVSYWGFVFFFFFFFFLMVSSISSRLVAVRGYSTFGRGLDLVVLGHDVDFVSVCCATCSGSLVVCPLWYMWQRRVCLAFMALRSVSGV